MPNAMKLNRTTQDWINLVLAFFLFVSPWVIGFVTTTAAAWNAWIIGIALAAMAIAALTAFAVWEEWLSLLLGAWLILSPLVVGFTAAAAVWTHVVLGILILGVAAWALWDYRHQRRMTA